VADVPDAIKPGATNVTLATFNATGYVPGSTTINVTVELMQADTEDNLETDCTPADVEIVLLQQFPPTEDWPIYGPPTAPYHDGVYWDLNGSGDIDFVDVVLFFLLFDNWMSEPGQPIALFDYNGNGWLGFDDLVLLFLEVP
jgi:PKD repeat protein